MNMWQNGASGCCSDLQERVPDGYVVRKIKKHDQEDIKMTVIEGLIRTEDDGSLSFGNYELETKSKVPDFDHFGDSYKVKTYKEITKLERNDLFVYESVPGTVVRQFKMNDEEVNFIVEGFEDTQIALGLEPEKEYRVYVDGIDVGSARTNLGGKLVFSVELGSGEKNIHII